jgi:hypothetical protein
VLFDVCGRDCAIDLNCVENVLTYQGATPIPGSPVGVHGVASLEGRPALVGDLGALFGWGSTTLTARTCIIFIRRSDRDVMFGLLADGVAGVVDATGRVPTDIARCAIPTQFARLMISSEKGEVPLLALAEVYRRLFGEDDVQVEVAS